MTTTATPTKTVTLAGDACPSWCANEPCSDGEHWAEPGTVTWPGITATSDADQGAPTFTAYPSYDGTTCPAPGVSLWIEGERVDFAAELTPVEAMALAHNLMRAAQVVTAG